MNEKFKLLEDDTIDFIGKTLYRIESLKDFGCVKKGEKGGYIEKENNLSIQGDAWVGGNAKVYGNASISESAKIYDNALISGNAEVYGWAKVSGNAWVYDSAWIGGNAEICDSAWIGGNAEICDNSIISMDAYIDDASSLITITSIGSEDGILTAFKNSQGGISVTRGCFNGTLNEFEQAVNRTHGDNEHAKTYKIAVKLIKSRLK